MDEVFLPGVTDLFGDPVPVNRGAKGRPAHVPTSVNRRRVTLALACGHAEEDVAAMLRISKATLRRHYFHELAGKRMARLNLEVKNLDAIVGQVDAGKTAAMALLDKKLEKLRKREASDQLQAPVVKAEKVGKKEAARRAAAEVAGLYAPLPQPGLLN